jgi:hypothetical protein
MLHLTVGVVAALAAPESSCEPERLITFDESYVAVDVVGSTAYCSGRGAGLDVFDVSDPAAPKLLGSFPLGLQGVLVRGGVAYLGDFNVGDQLLVYDVSDPGDIGLLGGGGGAGCSSTPSGVTLVLQGPVLAMTGQIEGSGLSLFDVDDPENPRRLDRIDCSSIVPNGIDIKDDYLYGADSSKGLLVFDITNPAVIELVATVPTTGFPKDVVVRGCIAYVAGSAGLELFDLNDPSAPAGIDVVPLPSEARMVSLDGNTAFLATVSDGVQIVDVSNPERAVVCGSYGGPDELWGVRAVNGVAYTWGPDGTFETHDVAACTICPPDFNGDGAVDTRDLVDLITAWGPCPDCRSDMNHDDVVDTRDLTDLLAAWGPCD